MADEVGGVDVGGYCREVERHLTRVNGGHLVRIVGPGFELVRAWAEEGVPLSVVCRGIDLKADRHRAGPARRPLRIEFCEHDVRDLYDGWRRAVGLMASTAGVEPGAPSGEAAPPAGEQRRKSLSKHLDRAVEKLARAAGRLDLPEALRDQFGEWLAEITELRDAARTLRGEARAELLARLGPLDARIVARTRELADPALLDDLDREASDELRPYRSRLPEDRWQRAVDATVERLLRDRWGLPTLTLAGA